VTGWRAYSPRVTAAFCVPGERIAGFLFIGHPDHALEERPRPALSDVVSRWRPAETNFLSVGEADGEGNRSAQPNGVGAPPSPLRGATSQSPLRGDRED
jgi:hypothetical protein